MSHENLEHDLDELKETLKHALVDVDAATVLACAFRAVERGCACQDCVAVASILVESIRQLYIHNDRHRELFHNAIEQLDKKIAMMKAITEMKDSISKAIKDALDGNKS